MMILSSCHENPRCTSPPLSLSSFVTSETLLFGIACYSYVSVFSIFHHFLKNLLPLLFSLNLSSFLSAFNYAYTFPLLKNITKLLHYTFVLFLLVLSI